MATINFARREIEAKIVYCGPALSGKTTNLRVLHGLIPPVQRGELHSLATDQERTLFFDYMPIELGQISGFTARFKLFTVPGQAFYRETRRVVLEGADAVVFVADSAPERAQHNVDALVDLEEHLSAHGLSIAGLPLVIQLNKRDATGAMSVVQAAGRSAPPENSWLAHMLGRKPRMLVALALANKMARGIWAMLTKGENYLDPVTTGA